MKRFNFIIVFTLIVFIVSCNEQEKEVSVSNYFNLEPPKDSAIIFGPEVISKKGRYEFGISFSIDGTQMIYSVQEGQYESSYFMYTQMQDSGWSNPEMIKLLDESIAGEMEAFFTPSGDLLYFVGYDTIGNTDIYEVEAIDFLNNKVTKLDSTINTGVVFFPTTTKSNKMYYADVMKRKILIADMSQDPPMITDPEFDMLGHPFISPNEDFLLIDPVVDTSNYQRNIQVAFKQDDGSWSDFIDLGDKVNTSYSETCPSLSHDGKYLFFSRYSDLNGMSDFYWVSAEVIEEKRPDKH